MSDPRSFTFVIFKTMVGSKATRSTATRETALDTTTLTQVVVNQPTLLPPLGAMHPRTKVTPRPDLIINPQIERTVTVPPLGTQIHL